MSSRIRFFGAGVAVSALCFLLASMTWQYVLGLFMLAGVGWGLWSWLSELEREREKEREARCRRRRLNSEVRTRWASQGRVTPSNVYPFPSRDVSGAQEPGRSEAAD